MNELSGNDTMSTDRRKYRFSQAIHRRQLDLVVALDRVHDRHNISAILRSADAIGISKVIWQPDIVSSQKLAGNAEGAKRPTAGDEGCEFTSHPEGGRVPPFIEKLPDILEKYDVNPEVAQGAQRWVKLERVDNLPERIKAYKKEGFAIAATHLGAEAIDYRRAEWEKPFVLVMGNERKGVSDEILALSDVNVYLPMMGLIQSLNVSVATAVILFEIQRHREIKGNYNRKLPEETIRKIYEAWNLGAGNLAVEDLLEPPQDLGPIPPSTYVDGRDLFIEKIRKKKIPKI